MECPCENCIVMIFCRQQKFSEFQYCDVLSHFLGFQGKRNLEFPVDIKMHIRNFPKVYKCLKPLRWKYRHWPKNHEHYKKTYRVTSVKRRDHLMGKQSVNST